MKPTKILVAIDGSEIASRAAGLGADLAAGLGAQLALVNVVDERGALPADGGPSRESSLEALRAEGKDVLAAAAADAGEWPPTHRFLRDGDPGHEIVASAAEWGADLLVIGTHGRGGLSRLLMGSTAEAVVRHSPCPVLVVPVSAFGSK